MASYDPPPLRAVLDQAGVGPTGRRVAAELARAASARGQVVRVTDRRLSELSGLSIASVRAGLSALEGAGVIRRLDLRQYLGWYFRAGIRPMHLARRYRIRRLIVLCWRVPQLPEPGRGFPPRPGDPEGPRVLDELCRGMGGPGGAL